MAGNAIEQKGKEKAGKMELKLIHNGPSSSERFINFSEQTEKAAVLHFKRLTGTQDFVEKLNIAEGDAVKCSLTKKSANGKKSDFDFKHAGPGKNKGTVVFTGSKLFKDLRLYKRAADEMGLKKGDVIEISLEKAQ